MEVALAATNADGLANRLKCLVSAWRQDPQARIRWVAAPICSAPLDALFADADKMAVPVGARVRRELGTWRLLLAPADAKHVPAGFSSVREFYGSETGWRDIDFEYSRIPRAVRDAFLPLFRRLRPQADVAALVEAFAWSRGFDAHTVAVHVRSWPDSAERRAKFFDLDAYERAMRAVASEDPKVAFFVCSDQSAHRDELVRRFAGRAVALKVDRDRAPAVHCLVELLLLARGRTLIASHVSTLSELAWWMGGCTARVLVVCKGRAPVDFPAPRLSEREPQHDAERGH